MVERTTAIFPENSVFPIVTHKGSNEFFTENRFSLLSQLDLVLEDLRASTTYNLASPAQASLNTRQTWRTSLVPRDEDAEKSNMFEQFNEVGEADVFGCQLVLRPESSSDISNSKSEYDMDSMSQDEDDPEDRLDGIVPLFGDTTSGMHDLVQSGEQNRQLQPAAFVASPISVAQPPLLLEDAINEGQAVHVGGPLVQWKDRLRLAGFYGA
ncbi:hypothetical protein TorRG33x02_190710 [Trema orientale]|uniref:Uncharacterized protein n=1 Tax=Trema orientale TaxID=63057 RepID=A0A2P5EHR4_TREOI|nr:hypothetical protein TorRG33x02_190710 [Trema orientale]